MLIDEIISKPPDHTSEDGKQWWCDVATTRYARSKFEGTEYAKAVVWIVKWPNGELVRLLTCDNKPLYEHQQLEQFAYRIDMMAASVLFDKKDLP